MEIAAGFFPEDAADVFEGPSERSVPFFQDDFRSRDALSGHHARIRKEKEIPPGSPSGDKVNIDADGAFLKVAGAI